MLEAELNGEINKKRFRLLAILISTIAIYLLGTLFNLQSATSGSKEIESVFSVFFGNLGKLFCGNLFGIADLAFVCLIIYSAWFGNRLRSVWVLILIPCSLLGLGIFHADIWLFGNHAPLINATTAAIFGILTIPVIRSGSELLKQRVKPISIADLFLLTALVAFLVYYLIYTANCEFWFNSLAQDSEPVFAGTDPVITYVVQGLLNAGAAALTIYFCHTGRLATGVVLMVVAVLLRWSLLFLFPIENMLPTIDWESFDTKYLWVYKSHLLIECLFLFLCMYQMRSSKKSRNPKTPIPN